MKIVSVLLLISCLLCACSKDEPAEPSRPGGEQPGQPAPDGYPDVSFASSNATEHRVDDADGSIHIILYREAKSGSLPYACGLALTEGSDFADIDVQADFTRGSSTAEAVLRYSPARMGAQQRKVTVKMVHEGKTFDIMFIRSAAEWKAAGAMLKFDGREYRRVESKCRVNGSKTDWIIGHGDTERQFTVENGAVSVWTTANVAPASAYGKGNLWPAVNVPCYFSDDYIALNVCGMTDGRVDFPHTEYFFRKAGRYAPARICDGWLLPVVAIDARLLNPAENIWTAPARLEDDGSVTVFGPYHNTSPLHKVNAAGADASWHIAVTGDGEAVMSPQFSAFSNADVFGFDFIIAAKGRYDSGMKSITFDRPLHNCTADGLKNSAVECTWGKLLPTVVTFDAETTLTVEH